MEVVEQAMIITMNSIKDNPFEDESLQTQVPTYTIYRYNDPI